MLLHVVPWGPPTLLIGEQWVKWDARHSMLSPGSWAPHGVRRQPMGVTNHVGAAPQPMGVTNQPRGCN